MQTTIENKGVTKTIINNNGNKDENEIKWKAKYDGEKANIDVKFLKNCKKDKLRIELNNTDLASILGIRSNPIPLEQRLKSDFLKLDSDSESDSDDEDDMDLNNVLKYKDTETLDTQQLEDDISKLLHIKTIKPTQKSTYKPQPYLFRVKIPEPSTSEKIIIHPRPKYRHKQISSKSESSIKPETITVSEMLFDPAFDLSAPPIKLREPTHIQLPNVLSSLTPESLLLPTSMLNKTNPFTSEFQYRNRPLTAKRGKNVKKSKTNAKKGKSKSKSKNAYKTPAPKTYRVHLTSNKGSRKSKS